MAKTEKTKKTGKIDNVDVKMDQENNLGVRKKGSKWFCVACGSMIETEHDCPECGQKVNWGRAIIEARRGPAGF